jgi:hypothetical protein
MKKSKSKVLDLIAALTTRLCCRLKARKIASGSPHESKEVLAPLPSSISRWEGEGGQLEQKDFRA